MLRLNKYSKPALFLFFVLSTHLLSGCGTIYSHFSDPHYETKTDIIIRPESTTVNAERVGIIDPIPGGGLSGSLGSSLARVAHRYLLKNQFAKVIELVEATPGNVEDAIKIGKEKQFDLILLGQINTAYFGGLSSSSQINMAVRLLDVRSETTLWYITGAREGHPEEKRDYFIFEKESKEAPSLYLLGQIVLERMLSIIVTK